MVTDQIGPVRALRFAISGVHGAGKTTLCHSVVARLRQNGVNAAVASESARQSLFLARRILFPSMEIEIFGLQLIEEMRATLTADIVMCDRSVLDTFAYCLARFPCTESGPDALFMNAISDFGRKYVHTYEKIFYLPNRIPLQSDRDAFRDTDPVSSEAVALAFEKLIATWHVNILRLEITTAVESIAGFIQSKIVS